MQSARSYAESRIGDEPTTALFGTAGFVLEAGGLVTGGVAARNVVGDIMRTAGGNEAAESIPQARSILRETMPNEKFVNRNRLIKSFELETFRVKTLTSELKEYRYFDGLEDGAKMSGGWSTSQWYANPDERIAKLALPNNQAIRAAEVTLSLGTIVFQGQVSPQLNLGPFLTGGGTQTFNAMGPRSAFKELP